MIVSGFAGPNSIWSTTLQRPFETTFLARRARSFGKILARAPHWMLR
jgi:hypothetical protein